MPLAKLLSLTVDEVYGMTSVVVTVFTSTFGLAVSTFDWLAEELDVAGEVDVLGGGETALATTLYERRLATASVVALPVVDNP